MKTRGRLKETVTAALCRTSALSGGAVYQRAGRRSPFPTSASRETASCVSPTTPS